MTSKSKKVAAIMGAISAYIRQESRKASQSDKRVAGIAKDKR